jgi:hypothetical protein
MEAGFKDADIACFNIDDPIVGKDRVDVPISSVSDSYKSNDLFVIPFDSSVLDREE